MPQHVRGQKQAWWTSVWPWGIVISITLTVLSVYVGDSAKAAAGIQCALIGVVLTTCVDVSVRSAKEHAATEKLLFDLHHIPPSMEPFISELAPFWTTVDAHGKSQILNLRSGLAHEMIEAAKNMADDRIATPRGRPYEWRRAQLAGFRAYSAIHDDDLAYWTTHVAREYLNQQKAAISRGLQARRIFVLRTQVGRAAIEPIISAQQDAGIAVRILAMHDFSAADDLDVCRVYSVNRVVVEEVGGGVFVTSRNDKNPAAAAGQSESWEIISYHEDDVEEATYGFQRLWAWSKDPDDYFGSQRPALAPSA